MPNPVTKTSNPKKVNVSTMTGLGISVIVHLIIFLFVGSVVIFEGKVPTNLFFGDLSGADLAPEQTELPPLMEEEVMEMPMENPLSEVTPTEMDVSIVEQMNTSDLIIAQTTTSVPTFSMPTGIKGPTVGVSTGAAKPVSKKSPGQARGTKTLFGSTGSFAGALEGTIIDFKQDAERKPTGMNDAKYRDELKKFARKKDWNLDDLDDFFIAPNKLYATHIFMPTMNADKAPEAFGVGNVMEGKMWMVLYKGNPVVPKTGKYRLWGFCDDFIFVKVNGKPVLDGSIFVSSEREKSYFHKSSDLDRKKYAFPQGSLVPGEWMDLQEGETLDMEIIISERPGGHFAAYLFVEEEGEKYKETPSGRPILPVFQVSDDADIDFRKYGGAPYYIERKGGVFAD